ncbi:hypothetical protein L873DRAFT_1697233 [Choiromyces venosus 120613-1]|uniref:Uncharacterized protein n=1 Tax=Choiromyces venosus 120613-1 TaxID=1336337 RepID=A0A3N4JP34_9PEZI|nr:hypothetical protein L873DRAFT_1697233 [Choiromyces venosus 120613-1]
MYYVPLNRDRLNSKTPRTRLSWDAENGHTEVVKLLMSWEVAGLYGGHFRARVPLFFAVLNGHEDVVRLVFSRHDVNRNSLDNSRETPLSVAITRGQVAMANRLLGRKDIILNRLAMAGFSAIYLATWSGHEEILEIALAWKMPIPICRARIAGGRSLWPWGREN